MQRLTHDEYYLRMLELVAARSTCARRAVGAIVVDRRHRILSTGYNGVPRNFPHCIERPCLGANDPPGDTRRCLAIHAEVNAILQCNRLDLAWKMYVSCSPCFSCAKMLANTNIQHVVCLQPYAESTEVLKQAGISLTVVNLTPMDGSVPA